MGTLMAIGWSFECGGGTESDAPASAHDAATGVPIDAQPDASSDARDRFDDVEDEQIAPGDAPAMTPCGPRAPGKFSCCNGLPCRGYCVDWADTGSPVCLCAMIDGGCTAPAICCGWSSCVGEDWCP